MTTLVNMRVAELKGEALNAAVALATGHQTVLQNGRVLEQPFGARYNPSEDWSQGGPLIDKWRVSIRIPVQQGKRALYLCRSEAGCFQYAPVMDSQSSPLTAAMRAIVAAHNGFTAPVPAQLAPSSVPAQGSDGQ